MEQLMFVKPKWTLLINLYFMYISHLVFVTYIDPQGLAEEENVALNTLQSNRYCGCQSKLVMQGEGRH